MGTEVAYSPQALAAQCSVESVDDGLRNSRGEMQCSVESVDDSLRNSRGEMQCSVGSVYDSLRNSRGEMKSWSRLTRTARPVNKNC